MFMVLRRKGESCHLSVEVVAELFSVRLYALTLKLRQCLTCY